MRVLLVLVVTAIHVAAFFSQAAWLIILGLDAFLAGVALTVLLFALLSPFLKTSLTFHVDRSNKVAMFLEVSKGRTSLIMQGGRPIRVIPGGDHYPTRAKGMPDIWYLYQRFIFRATGLHAYIPFFTKPYVYDLPRHKRRKSGDAYVYEIVSEGDPGYRTDHVRTEWTTLIFVLKGLDIQRIPFTLFVAVQMRIRKDDRYVLRSLFSTDTWNVLLETSLTTIARSVFRSRVSLDMALGTIPQQLWADADLPEEKAFAAISRIIYDRLMQYKIFKDNNGLGEDPEQDQSRLGDTLYDLGLDIGRIDILDVNDELPAPERAKFLAAALGREQGRARDLEGQGVANAAKHLRQELENGGELAESIVRNRALVDAADRSDVVTALLTTLAQKNQGK